MVEQQPVTRRTLKALTGDARKLDNSRRSQARRRLKAEGYRTWHSLSLARPSHPELFLGHTWKLGVVAPDGKGVTTLDLSYSPDIVKIDMGTVGAASTTTVEIPLMSYRRPAKEAVQTTLTGTESLTEDTAKKTQNLLKQLASSEQ